jgi:hypothetical protein
MLVQATGLVMALVVATPPVALAQSAFVKIWQGSESSVVFADTGGIQRDGAEIVIDVLVFNARPEGDPVAFGAYLTTYRYSCDWNTSATLDRVDYAPDGSTTKPPMHPDDMRPWAFGPGGWQAKAGPIFCDALAPRPADAPRSVTEAITEGARLTKRPPASKKQDPNGPIMMARPAPVAPYVFPNFPSPATSRYGLIKRDAATGNVHYLDWGNLVRKGDVIHALTIEGFGAQNRLKQASVKIDCAAMSVTVLGYVGYNSYMTQEHAQDMRWPMRTAKDWSLGGLIADAACKGEAPVATLPSREAVMAALVAMPGSQPLR